jgi:hypothetical protein
MVVFMSSTRARPPHTINIRFHGWLKETNLIEINQTPYSLVLSLSSPVKSPSLPQIIPEPELFVATLSWQQSKAF